MITKLRVVGSELDRYKTLNSRTLRVFVIRYATSCHFSFVSFFARERRCDESKLFTDNAVIISVFLSLRRRRRVLFFPSRIFFSLSLSLSLFFSLFLFGVGANERSRRSIQAMMRNNNNTA